MFFKLLKHDLKMNVKPFVTMYIIFFVATMMYFNIIRYSQLEGPTIFDTYALNLIIFGSFIGFLVVVGVIVLVVNSISFIKTTMFDDAGYLTMTLPVSRHLLLWSKVATLLFWIIISYVATVLIMFVNCSLVFGSVKELQFLMTSIIEWFQYVPNQAGLFLNTISSLLFQVILLIFVMAFVNSSISPWKNYFLSLLMFIIINALRDWAQVSIFNSYGQDLLGQSTNWISILISLLLFTIFYFGTVWLIDRKLEI